MIAVVPECKGCSSDIVMVCPEYTTQETLSVIPCACPSCGGRFVRVLPHYRSFPGDKRLRNYTACRTLVPKGCLVLAKATKFSRQWTCGNLIGKCGWR